jgi:hypothetical protein
VTLFAPLPTALPEDKKKEEVCLIGLVGIINHKTHKERKKTTIVKTGDAKARFLQYCAATAIMLKYVTTRALLLSAPFCRLPHHGRVLAFSTSGLSAGKSHNFNNFQPSKTTNTFKATTPSFLNVRRGSQDTISNRQQHDNHSSPAKIVSKARTALEEQSNDGEFKRRDAAWRSWVSREEGAKHTPEADRYHLYVAYACPWAHRTLMTRALKGLEDTITITVVHPTWQKTKPEDPDDSHTGWVFGKPCDGESFVNTAGKGGPFPSAFPGNGKLPNLICPALLSTAILFTWMGHLSLQLGRFLFLT